MKQHTAKNNSQPDDNVAALVSPPTEVLSRSNKKVRYVFSGLVTISLLMAGAVLFHEYYVLTSLPTGGFHKLAHAGLLTVAALLLAAVWLLGLVYRRMRAYEAVLLDSYRNLDYAVKERTRALSDSQALLESLFDAFRERALVIDADTRIVRANRMAGDKMPNGLCGRRFEDVYPGCQEQDERRSELQLIKYTFDQGKPQRNRLIRGGTDCDRIFSVDTYPVFCSAESAQLVIEVVRDVTDSKFLEMQHQHHDKMAVLGLLAAGIAHNLGNPLASLSSELQMLKGETEIQRIQTSLETLNKHVQRMTRSIHEILGFARKRGDTVRPVSIPDAVNDILRLLRHDPRARGVRFETEFEANLPEILFNEDDLILILLNVVVNALDAMPAGGTVRLTGHRDVPGTVLLSISDSGKGMDSRTLEQAFRPLFTTKASGSGTGLGLAVVYNVMRSSNGSVSIESVPGEGTKVTLKLPVHTLQNRGG